MQSGSRFLLILFIGGLVGLRASHGYGAELYEPAGRFAYTVPPGWEVRDNPQGRYSSMFHYKMAVDPKTNARIVVSVFNDPSVTLKDRRDAVVQVFASQLPRGETRLATESVIETTSGQHAICLFFPSKSLHRWAFFFRRRDKTIVQVDCSAPAESSYDQLIETTINTFRITQSQR
jgi:hypothetical protein